MSRAAQQALTSGANVRLLLRASHRQARTHRRYPQAARSARWHEGATGTMCQRLLNLQSGRSRNSGDVLKKTPATRRNSSRAFRVNPVRTQPTCRWRRSISDVKSGARVPALQSPFCDTKPCVVELLNFSARAYFHARAVTS